MKKFVEEFFHIYLFSRDYEKTISFFTEDILYIGTGKHEIAVGRKAAQEMLRAEMRELPRSFHFEMYEYAQSITGENQASAFASLRVELIENEARAEMLVRFTCNCVRRADGWKISCLHMSTAESAQPNGEFFTHKIELLTFTDSLTGLENRTKFSKKLQQSAPMEGAGCIVADINNLKLCNAKYGHAQGDAMLVDVAQVIDAAHGECGSCYRVGGDEFCLLIPSCDKHEILQILHRIKAGIALRNQERSLPISIAFGYALQESADESLKVLFDRGVEMMQDAKFRMKNEFSVYHDARISNYLNVLKFLRKITDNYFYIWDIPRDEFWFFDDVDREYAVHTTSKPTITAGEMKRVIHHVDYPMVLEDLERIAKGVQREHNLDYRWINKRGEIVWMNCYGQVVEDDEGAPFCMIGRVSDQVLRHLYHPLTRIFNKEKMMQDFAQDALSNGYFMLLRVESPNGTGVKNEAACAALICKCADILEGSGIALHLWHTEEDCLALYLDVASEAEVKKLFALLLGALDGVCTLSAGAIADTGEMSRHRELMYSWARLTQEKARANGSNTLMFFVKQDMEKQIRSVRLLGELHHSIENGCKGFYLNYQPLVKCRNYQLYGAEALLRYHSEDLGEVYPDEFIPLLEQTKLIDEVGLWVLETALRQCGAWRARSPEFHINVNFSVSQLDKPDIAEKVLNVLAKTGVPGEALTIELTENVHMHGMPHLDKIFRAWKNAGIALSIDDFGTGYASMGYLSRLDVAEIKIDRAYVAQIRTATYNYNLVSSVINFAKNANIRVICEGVEDMHELLVLEQLAPNLMQGYLFSSPCEPERFERTFLEAETPEHRAHMEQLQRIYQHKSLMNVVHYDAKDILRETDVGLWIIRISEGEPHFEMYADETMERILGVDRKYTMAELYRFWHDRIVPEYAAYVEDSVKYMVESKKVIQIQYLWKHPKLGEVLVRCSGKRVEDSNDMIVLHGYHRIVSTIEEMDLPH